MQDEINQRIEQLSQASPDTPVDENVVYLELVKPVKGRLYGLGSCGRVDASGASSSAGGPSYGSHEYQEMCRDYRRMQEALLKEQMERESLGRDLRDNQRRLQEENAELRSRYQRLEALVMSQHRGYQPTQPPHSHDHPDDPSRHLDDIGDGSGGVQTQQPPVDASTRQDDDLLHDDGAFLDLLMPTSPRTSPRPPPSAS